MRIHKSKITHDIKIFSIILLVMCFVSITTDFFEAKNNRNSASIVVPGDDFPSKYVGEFTFTHYAKTGNRTATGHNPRKGRTVAVDPNIIPLHSIVYINGLGYFVAEDTGRLIKGHKIDVYVEDKLEAIKLGTLNGAKLKVWIMTEGENYETLSRKVHKETRNNRGSAINNREYPGRSYLVQSF